MKSMMTGISVAIALIAGVLNWPANAETTKFDPLAPLVQFYMVKGDNAGTCSGAFISPTEIITAAHCLKGFDIDKLWIYDSKGSVYKPKSVWFSHTTDMGMVTIGAESSAPVAEISCRIPERGEKLTVVGHPLALVNIQTTVEVAGYKAPDPFTGAPFPNGNLITVGTVLPGMSGGPNYDKDNKIVSVTSAGLKYQSNPREPFVHTDLNLSTLLNGYEMFCNKEKVYAAA